MATYQLDRVQIPIGHNFLAYCPTIIWNIPLGINVSHWLWKYQSMLKISQTIIENDCNTFNCLFSTSLKPLSGQKRLALFKLEFALWFCGQCKIFWRLIHFGTKLLPHCSLFKMCKICKGMLSNVASAKKYEGIAIKVPFSTNDLDCVQEWRGEIPFFP